MLLVLVAIPLAGCTVDLGGTAAPASEPDTLAGPSGETPLGAGQVLLRESSVSWETYQYELTEVNSIVDGSYDGVTKVERSYQSWILENDFLKVTLVPEMGGRILSIVYKPTGHEELYQNPVGVPYQIGTDIFYYDWLMVYGGIFPTFPEPEHGKMWLQSWDFEVVDESAQRVVVAMSIKDDIDNPNAPSQYDTGATGMEVTYVIALQSGRAALDTTVVLSNPGPEDVAYEYWTNTTLAPGSDPLDPRTTAGAEIIAPIDTIKIPGYWEAIAEQEEKAGLTGIYEFANLRRFENWPDMGIAYAFPDMGDQNFWGVINHDNGEGIFRIADNTVTPGMKIWTWGYPHSTSVDPQVVADESRPYIELWAGVTREFWQKTELPAGAQLEIEEVYSPSVGLDNVTHANRNFLINLAPDGPSAIRCQFFGLFPEQTVIVRIDVDGNTVYDETAVVDAVNGNSCSTELPDVITGDTLSLSIKSQDGDPLFEGAVSLVQDS